MSEPTRRKPRPPRWSGIRARVIAVLLIPLVAALGFGGARLYDTVSSYSTASQAATIAEVLPSSYRLAIQLTAERDAAGSELPDEAMAEIHRKSDVDIAEWSTHLRDLKSLDRPRLSADLEVISLTLARVDQLRQELTDREKAAEARESYTETIRTLLGLAGRTPALADQSIYYQIDVLAGVRLSSEAIGTMLEVMMTALATGELSPQEHVRLTQAFTTWSDNTRRFYAVTSAETRDVFDESNGGTTTEGSVGAPMMGAVERVVESADIASLNLSPEEWRAAAGEFFLAMKEVIVTAATDLAAEVDEVRAEERRSALIDATAILLLLLAALGVALFAARSIIRPLRELRDAAMTIAEDELPARIRLIENSSGELFDDTTRPVEVTSPAEVGEVAEAFGQVHAEAVRLACSQAELRASVNKMFINLSRRSQSLVDRQISLLDGLEESEQDPDALSNLFQLDNLATRMRRNDESLLVLAGGVLAQAGHGSHVPVLDVLRAATSQVEQFARVEVDTTSTAPLRGTVAADVVHLVAELVDNATRYSPPHTQVTIETSQSGTSSPLVIRIEDQGIGMSAEQLDEANFKLHHEVDLTEGVGRTMGLVVVSRLARRHRIRVTLQANSPSGVIARVQVPASAINWDAAEANEEPTTAPAPLPAAAPPSGPEPAPAPPPAAVPPQRPEPMPEPEREPVRAVREPVAATTATSAAIPVNGHDALSGHSTAGSQVSDADSPIYATLKSAWFAPRTETAPERRDSADTPQPTTWRSPGDEGWDRAADVSRKIEGEPTQVTPGGLPKRVPGEHLVPGTASPTPVAPAASNGNSAAPPRRSNLSNFQRGVSSARSRTVRTPAQKGRDLR